MKNFGEDFLRNFAADLDEIQYVQIIFKGKNSADFFFFLMYIINIVLCRDTCEPICFKLGMVLDTTTLYSLIPVCMALMFTQGHGGTGKLELVQSLCCKVAWSNSKVDDD